MKKILFLIITLVATTSLWAYDFQQGYLYYNIIDEKKSHVEVESMSEHNDYYDYITNIIVPATVKMYGKTYTVVSIGDGAFRNYLSLRTITLPSTITHVGVGAFTNSGVYKNSNYWSNGIMYINNCLIAIRDFVSDKVTIRNGTRVIADKAFSDCSEVTSVTIPSSVICIGDDAFLRCSGLRSVNIPNGVMIIGCQAFYGCKSLTSVTIPSSVKSLGGGGNFQECTALKSVQWNATNCTLDEYSNDNYYPPFHNLSSIKNFTFGNNVKSIPACLCYELSGLTSIVIPDGVTNIGKSAFKGCSSLKAIDVPDSVMIIEACAFAGCKSLKIIALPSNAMIIENGAFADCNSWRVIRYGGTVKQCERRYRYWDQCFHSEIIYCTDGDTQIHW
jgi:hypothetical protein